MSKQHIFADKFSAGELYLSDYRMPARCTQVNFRQTCTADIDNPMEKSCRNQSSAPRLQTLIHFQIYWCHFSYYSKKKKIKNIEKRKIRQINWETKSWRKNTAEPDSKFQRITVAKEFFKIVNWADKESKSLQTYFFMRQAYISRTNYSVCTYPLR